MKTSLIMAVALAGAFGAFAQQADRKENNQPVAQTEKSADELKVTDQELEKRVSDVNKATKFMGMQIKNPRNETVGKVSDLALDLKTGRIAYAVVSVGGFLGVGDKMVAVPIEALTVEKGAKHLLLDVGKQQVEQAAGFSENNWPDLDAVKSGKTIGFTAKADTEKGVGGTGSEAEEAKGTERAEQKRPSSQPVTSISAISANREPSALNGRQVRLTGVKVQEVFEGNFAIIGSDQDRQKVLVKTPTGGPQLQTGQTINLTGTIREISDPTQVGLDANAAQKIQGQKVYIEAGQVTPTGQK